MEKLKHKIFLIFKDNDISVSLWSYKTKFIGKNTTTDKEKEKYKKDTDYKQLEMKSLTI